MRKRGASRSGVAGWPGRPARSTQGRKTAVLQLSNPHIRVASRGKAGSDDPEKTPTDMPRTSGGRVVSRKFSDSRKGSFLAALSVSGNQTLSAERVKVSRSWVCLQRKSDAAFDAAVRGAIAGAKVGLRTGAHRPLPAQPSAESPSPPGGEGLIGRRLAGGLRMGWSWSSAGRTGGGRRSGGRSAGGGRGPWRSAS